VEDMRNGYKILIGKAERNSLLGIPKFGREDIIKIYLRSGM
jgi:hypothetical protein